MPSTLWVLRDANAADGPLTGGRTAGAKRSPASRLELVGRERDERRGRYVVDDDLWHQSMMRSARDNTQLAEAARQGIGILGPGTPPPLTSHNIARDLDFVAESITHIAEQAREVLSTKPKRPKPNLMPCCRGR